MKHLSTIKDKAKDLFKIWIKYDSFLPVIFFHTVQSFNYTHIFLNGHYRGIPYKIPVDSLNSNTISSTHKYFFFKSVNWRTWIWIPNILWVFIQKLAVKKLKNICLLLWYFFYNFTYFILNSTWAAYFFCSIFL